MFFGHCGYGQYDYVKDQDTNKFSIRDGESYGCGIGIV
jgi:hypothetical protein